MNTVASSAAATDSPESKKEKRKEKLESLKKLLLGENAATIEDVLNQYSEYGSFEDGERGTVYQMGDSDDFNDNVDEEQKKSIVFFFSKLSEAKLQIGQVSGTDIGEEKVDWSDFADWEEFLPDDTEFQRTIPELVLWKRRLGEKPTACFGRDQAYSSLDFNCTDYGDVLWKLEVPSAGFPVGEDTESGVCILREHHRQVMFIALRWLLQNGIALGLTATDYGSPPPAAVAAICGSPGIGKSRSLIFLMWVLLKRKSPFLLEAGSPDDRYFCLVRPRENTVRFLSDTDEARGILKADRSVYCIVDPPQLQEGKEPEVSPLLDMKGPVCVTSPSADPLHLPNAGKERTVLRKFWVCPWILSLLRAVGPAFTPDFSQVDNELIRKRFQVVGGIPRAIFRESAFESRQMTIDQTEIDKDVDRLYDALVHDKDEKKMVKKVPQAFMAYYCQLPFTHVKGEKNVWVDFLSQEGRNRYGMHVFEKLRTGIIRCDDYSSAGMFFDRWVGSLLSSKKTEFIQDFKLRAFVGGKAVKEDIQMPLDAVVHRYTDEEVLLSDLLQDEFTKQDMPFPTKQVREAPRSTPVYDFAIDRRWFLNATLAESHPVSKEKIAKLAARVGADKDDPLNLVFFVLNEKTATKYSSKKGGQTYTGDVKAPDVSSSQVKRLKPLVVDQYSAAKLRQVAVVLDVPVKEMGQKRSRSGVRLGEFEQKECDVPPNRLFRSIMEKMSLTGKNETLNKKWERLVTYVGGLDDNDPVRDLKFDSGSVKQHVVTLVPEKKSTRV